MSAFNKIAKELELSYEPLPHLVPTKPVSKDWFIRKYDFDSKYNLGWAIRNKITISICLSMTGNV